MGHSTMGPDDMGIIDERMPIHGHMTLRTYQNADAFTALSNTEVLQTVSHLTPNAVAESDNVLCVNGLTIMIQALLWASLADQNDAMGDPFSASVMYPLYGALGTGDASSGGATPASQADVTLVAEYARSVVVQGGAASASNVSDPALVWSFLFGAPGTSQTVTEAGVMMNASSVANSGALFDHASISPSVSWGSTELMTLTVVITMGN